MTTFETGRAYFKPNPAPPGEVECCEKCMVFRQENPGASPLVVSVNHSDQHVEWIHLGTVTDLRFDAL